MTSLEGIDDVCGWRTVVVGALDSGLVRRLLDNDVAAARIPNFLPADVCRASAAALAGASGWTYYEGATPPLGRLGITQYEHFGAMDEYLRQAEQQLGERRRILEGLPDPTDLLIEQCDEIWPAGAAIASEDGRTYFAGVFRRGAAGTIHADWAPRDGQGWAIGSVIAQLGWNLYYDVPEDGGDLVVYNRPWTPDMESIARQRFNDYDPESFRRVEHVEVSLAAGDLVLFNAKNAHQVRSSLDAARRVSVGSFIGEMPDGRLAFWS